MCLHAALYNPHKEVSTSLCHVALFDRDVNIWSELHTCVNYLTLLDKGSVKVNVCGKLLHIPDSSGVWRRLRFFLSVVVQCVRAWGGHCCPIIRASGPPSSCEEGRRLGAAGEEGLLGTLSGNYGQTGTAFRWWQRQWGKMSEPTQQTGISVDHKERPRGQPWSALNTGDVCPTHGWLGCWFTDSDLLKGARNICMWINVFHLSSSLLLDNTETNPVRISNIIWVYNYVKG